MGVRIIDASEDRRWDEFVLNHRLGSIYHHSAWKQVIENSFNNATPLYFVLEDERGKLKSAIPLFLIRSWLTGNRLVSLPFSPFSDPLVDSVEDFNKLLEAISNESKKLKASYLEMRILKSYNLLDIDLFRENFFYFYKTYRLPLENGIPVLKKSFHKTAVQQRIKKAEKNLKVRFGKTEKDMKEFYNLYVLLSAKKHGIPPKPFRFFQNMLKYLLPNNLMTLLISEYNDKIIGAIILLKFKQVVHSEYLASDIRYQKYHPNHFLIWKAIEMGYREGFQYFDFGRATSSNKGLVEFKQKWATDEYEVPYIYFPKMTGVTSLQADSKKIRLSNRIIRKLPLTLTKAISGRLYNHMGGEPNILLRRSRFLRT